jgi:hypothetical protein
MQAQVKQKPKRKPVEKKKIETTKFERKSIAFNHNPTVLKKNRILFIFDASYSMLNNWNSGQRMDVAKKLLGEFVDSLKTKSNLEIALRCYGHQFYIGNGKNCKDSRLEVPFALP